jgi:hypothetical protein
VIEHHVVEVALEGLDAEAVAERDQHVEGRGGDPGPGGGGAGVQGPHVVQAVGELDHQHPDVLAGGHDHLADGLGLGDLAVERLVELGHAVDQVGHLGAEVALQRLQRVAGVLDRVVQQRGDQRGRVHAQLGADLRDRERMGDVRVAALAELTAVHVFRDGIAAAQDAGVCRGVNVTVGAGEGGDGVVVVALKAEERT